MRPVVPNTFTKRVLLLGSMVVVCVLFAPATLAAQSFIRIDFISESPDAAIEDILFFNAGVEFSRTGYSTVRDGRRIRYIVEIEYTFDGETIDAVVRLKTGRNGQELISETSGSLEFGFDLDQGVADVVETLVAQLEPPDDDEEAGEIVGLIDPNVTTRVYTDGAFDVALAVPLVVLLGEITQYFSYASGGTFEGGYVLPGRGPNFSLGVSTSVFRVFNDPGVVGGQLLLTSLGGYAGLGSVPGARFGYNGTLAVGGTVITVLKDDGDVLAKVAPHAEARIRAGFSFVSHWYLGADVGFRAIFDSELIIMSATPGFVIRWEYG